MQITLGKGSPFSKMGGEDAFELSEKPNEKKDGGTNLPEHLTRFGTLMTIACSFLYSLFDRRKDSTNLLRSWTGFDHPFHQDIEVIAKRLEPFEGGLYEVRSRYDFHGSLTHAHQVVGFSIFEDPRNRELFAIVHDMKQLAVNMVVWYMAHGPAELVVLLPALKAELLGPTGSAQ